jgi:hypothetical protein
MQDIYGSANPRVPERDATGSAVLTTGLAIRSLVVTLRRWQHRPSNSNMVDARASKRLTLRRTISEPRDIFCDERKYHAREGSAVRARVLSPACHLQTASGGPGNRVAEDHAVRRRVPQLRRPNDRTQQQAGNSRVGRLAGC